MLQVAKGIISKTSPRRKIGFMKSTPSRQKMKKIFHWVLSTRCSAVLISNKLTDGLAKTDLAPASGLYTATRAGARVCGAAELCRGKFQYLAS